MLMALLVPAGWFIGILWAAADPYGDLLIQKGPFFIAAAVVMLGSWRIMKLEPRHVRRVGLARQRLADHIAQDTLTALVEGRETPAFSLYLRAFVTTDAYRGQDVKYVKMMAAQQTALAFVPFGTSVGAVINAQGAAKKDPEQARELELALVKAVGATAPLVCLGAPLEHRGAGRAKVADAAWQDAVRLFCEKAELIILAPSERPGTRWEVDYVLENGLMDRCVIINLPDQEKLVRKKDKKREWEGIREKFVRHGYELRENAKKGSLIYFGRSKSPLVSISLASLNERQLVDFLSKVRAKLLK